MIRILLSPQPLPVLEQDFKLLCINTVEKGKIHIYVNTRWFTVHLSNQRNMTKESETILVSELESTENVEETLTNWFTEDSFTWLKISDIQNFLQFYNLIDSPDIFEVLATETTADGTPISRAILINELDFLLNMEDSH